MRQSALTHYQSDDRGGLENNYRSPDWLQYQYWELGQSLRQLADKADVTQRTIRVWMQKHGIPRRRHGRPTDGDTEPLKDAEWLRRRYWYDCLSTREIGDLLDVSYFAVQCWMREHGIERRSEGEHTFNESGRLDYGPGWNEEKRESVRERDGRECADCGLSESEQQEMYGRALNVHHHIPARESSNPAVYNAERNLITLCQSCHTKREVRSDDYKAGGPAARPEC